MSNWTVGGSSTRLTRHVCILCMYMIHTYLHSYLGISWAVDCYWVDGLHDLETTKGGLALEAGHECRYGCVVPWSLMLFGFWICLYSPTYMTYIIYLYIHTRLDMYIKLWYLCLHIISLSISWIENPLTSKSSKRFVTWTMPVLHVFRTLHISTVSGLYF